MEDKPLSAWSLVKVPAILTLFVTLLRLVGELQGWSPALFNGDAGGGGALVGISWLILIFGFWFGNRLQRKGRGIRKPGKALAIYLVALAAAIGTGYGFYEAGMMKFPTEEAPGEFVGMGYFMAALGIGVVIAFAAWWRLSGTLLLYGVLARIPVIIVTYLAIKQGWDTHYVKLPPGAPEPADEMEHFISLAMPQLTVWIVATIIGGGICGCLGALAAGKRHQPHD